MKKDIMEMTTDIKHCLIFRIIGIKRQLHGFVGKWKKWKK
jgi:hypothetical protein